MIKNEGWSLHCTNTEGSRGASDPILQIVPVNFGAGKREMLHKCNRVTLGFLVLKHRFTQRIYIYISYIYIFFIYIFTHTRAHTQKKSLIGFLCSSKNSWQLDLWDQNWLLCCLRCPTANCLSKADARVYLAGGAAACLRQEQPPIGTHTELVDFLPGPCRRGRSLRQVR